MIDRKDIVREELRSFIISNDHMAYGDIEVEIRDGIGGFDKLPSDYTHLKFGYNMGTHHQVVVSYCKIQLGRALGKILGFHPEQRNFMAGEITALEKRILYQNFYEFTKCLRKALYKINMPSKLTKPEILSSFEIGDQYELIKIKIKGSCSIIVVV